MAQPISAGNHSLEFREMLAVVAKRIDDYTLDSLKYQCRDIIGSGRLEKIDSARGLFEVLEERDELDHENVDYLQKILKNVDRIDLCKLVQKYRQQWIEGFTSAPEPSSSSKTFSGEAHTQGVDERGLKSFQKVPEFKESQHAQPHTLQEHSFAVRDNCTVPFDTSNSGTYSDRYENRNRGGRVVPEQRAIPSQVTTALEVVISSISRGWQSSARHLGVPESVIEDSESNWPRNIRNQIRDSFQHWARTDPAPSVQKIIEAMRRVGRNDIADDLQYG